MLASLTDLGDSTLLLPASLVLVLYLLGSGWRRAAVALAASVALCIGLTVTAKVGFQFCAPEAGPLGIHSPSGHTAFATAFYGSGALLLGTGRTVRTRASLLMVSVLIAVAVAWSRLRLHFHTGPEILAGFLLGLLALSCFRLWWTEREATPLSPFPVLATVTILFLATHGHHLPGEGWIAEFTRMLERNTLGQCPNPPPSMATAFNGALPPRTCPG